VTDKNAQALELQRWEGKLAHPAGTWNAKQQQAIQDMISRLKQPRPSKASIIGLLHQKNMLVVHFTYVGKGTDKHLYPDDLQNAIATRREYLCASTVKPGDQPLVHSVGNVGVILEPLDDFSIAKVTHGDGGTSNSAHEYPLIEEMSDSITNRGKAEPYNQWTFESANVRGVFVWGDGSIERVVRIPSPLPHEAGLNVEMPQITSLSLADLANDFPGQRVFTIDGPNFVELHADGSCSVAQHTDIYS
jgi:hypothetical protein